MQIVLRVASVALVTFLLSGCVPQPPDVTPAPEPSSTPVFASDEDALAAAEAAYAAYQAAVDASLASYDTAALSTVASEQALDTALASVQEFKDSGKHQIGVSSTDRVSLVQGGGGSLYGDGDSLQIYACLDVSATDVVDATGLSVLPSPRQSRFPILATLELGSGHLLVAEEEVWDGSDFCQ